MCSFGERGIHHTVIFRPTLAWSDDARHCSSCRSICPLRLRPELSSVQGSSGLGRAAISWYFWGMQSRVSPCCGLVPGLPVGKLGMFFSTLAVAEPCQTHWPQFSVGLWGCEVVCRLTEQLCNPNPCSGSFWNSLETINLPYGFYYTRIKAESWEGRLNMKSHKTWHMIQKIVTTVVFTKQLCHNLPASCSNQHTDSLLNATRPRIQASENDTKKS